jgi:hypothetical protein
LEKSNSTLAARLSSVNRDFIELEYRQILAMLKRSAEINENEVVEWKPFVSKETMAFVFLSEKMRYYSQLIKYAL